MLEKLKEELELNIELTGEFHKFIAEKFKVKALEYNSNILRRKKAFEVFRVNGIPKRCKFSFLKDMETLGLIKLKDKQNIELLN